MGLRLELGLGFGLVSVLSLQLGLTLELMLELVGGYGLSLNDRLGVGFNNMHRHFKKSKKNEKLMKQTLKEIQEIRNKASLGM